MGRASTKRNKNVYQIAREDLELTREKAAEISFMDDSKIERIESGKTQASPWDVISLAAAYKKPELCNQYCANECPIGMKYVTEIKLKDLPQVILEMISSLNSMEKSQERLIEIGADGEIKDNELEDFIHIQEELERISLTVDSLKLWTEKMLASGRINAEQYNKLKGIN